MLSPYRKQFDQPSQAGGGFNPLAAGKKHYGAGRSMPNVGKTANKAGYGERDARAAARRNALIKRASSGGN